MKVYLVIHRATHNSGHGQSDSAMELVTDAWPYGGDKPFAFASREAGEAFLANRGWNVELLEVEVR